MKIKAKLVKIGDEYGFEVSEKDMEEGWFEEGKKYNIKFKKGVVKQTLYITKSFKKNMGLKKNIFSILVIVLFIAFVFTYIKVQNYALWIAVVLFLILFFRKQFYTFLRFLGL